MSRYSRNVSGTFLATLLLLSQPLSMAYLTNKLLRSISKEGGPSWIAERNALLWPCLALLLHMPLCYFLFRLLWHPSFAEHLTWISRALIFGSIAGILAIILIISKFIPFGLVYLIGGILLTVFMACNVTPKRFRPDGFGRISLVFRQHQEKKVATV